MISFTRLERKLLAERHSITDESYPLSTAQSKNNFVLQKDKEESAQNV